jgi:hypothetical protein
LPLVVWLQEEQPQEQVSAAMEAEEFLFGNHFSNQEERVEEVLLLERESQEREVMEDLDVEEEAVVQEQQEEEAAMEETDWL